MVHTSGSLPISPVNRIRYLAMPFIPLHMRRRMLSLSVITAITTLVIVVLAPSSSSLSSLQATV
jgi:hypothetical protein